MLDLKHPRGHQGLTLKQGPGLAQLRELLPSMAQVQFLNLAYVGEVCCWLSPFSVLEFPPSTINKVSKLEFDLDVVSTIANLHDVVTNYKDQKPLHGFFCFVNLARCLGILRGSEKSNKKRNS